MGTASLVVGIFALIAAAIGTAPFLGLVAPLGAGLGVIALGLGIAQIVKSFARRRGREDGPDPEWGPAWRGLILGVAAAVWGAGMFLVKGYM